MKKIKIITISLFVVLVTMVAFFGVYVPTQNRMEDQVKDYSYAMDLKGTRNIRLKVSDQNKTTIKDKDGKEVEDSSNLTEEQITQNGYIKEETPYNTEEVKNVDNYRQSKKIIEKRLEKLSVDHYTIKLDEQSGDMIIEFTENTKTDSIISNVNTVGKFEIADSQTNEVLMTNSDIKLANVMYGSNSSQSATSKGTNVYLNIEFTKEGTKKLEEVSGNYIKQETTENTTNETQKSTAQDDTANEKKISMKIDGEEIMSTNFEEPLRTGKLQLSIGSSATDERTLQGYVEQASNRATVLDTGNIPVKYEVEENQYVLSDITKDQLKTVGYVLLGITIVALMILVIRYKTLGLLGAISYIGLISTLLLVIRYTNVVLSIEGIFGIVMIGILNYVFINQLVNKNYKKGKEIELEDIKNINKETYQRFFVKLIPIIIMVITFSFMKWIPISSFGMVMFWGIALMAIYNMIITNNILKIRAKK